MGFILSFKWDILLENCPLPRCSVAVDYRISTVDCPCVVWLRTKGYSGSVMKWQIAVYSITPLPTAPLQCGSVQKDVVGWFVDMSVSLLGVNFAHGLFRKWKFCGGIQKGHRNSHGKFHGTPQVLPISSLTHIYRSTYLEECWQFASSNHNNNKSGQTTRAFSNGHDLRRSYHYYNIHYYEDWHGNRTQVVELLVKCFTAQLCSRDKKHMLLARHHPIS